MRKTQETLRKTGEKMIEYLSCGNIMSDTVARDDGTFSSENIGGPALYALAGIRLDG